MEAVSLLLSSTARSGESGGGWVGPLARYGTSAPQDLSGRHLLGLGVSTFHLFFCAFHFHHSLSLYVHFTGDFTGDSRVICS